MAKNQKTKYKKHSKKNEAPKRWLWFALGLLTGLFFALWLHHQQHLPDVIKSFSKNERDSSQKTKKTVQQEKSKVPKFDFYSMLPKNQQTATKEEPQTAPSVKKEVTIKQPTSVPVKKHSLVNYYLQAAAFKNAQEADRMKAQLILAGYDVSINTSTKDNIVLYRVYVGPYHDKKRAIFIQKKLKTAHVKTILIKNETDLAD